MRAGSPRELFEPDTTLRHEKRKVECTTTSEDARERCTTVTKQTLPNQKKRNHRSTIETTTKSGVRVNLVTMLAQVVQCSEHDAPSRRRESITTTSGTRGEAETCGRRPTAHGSDTGRSDRRPHVRRPTLALARKRPSWTQALARRPGEEGRPAPADASSQGPLSAPGPLCHFEMKRRRRYEPILCRLSVRGHYGRRTASRGRVVT